MPEQAPPRVSNIELYWADRPPQLSDRCAWWEARIKGGWRRNSRVHGLGYYGSAGYFGVYIWEWLNILAPLLSA